MFSGIVEACVQAKEIKERQENVELILEKPFSFNDLKEGDSVSVDGVCLTVESFTGSTMTFALAAESLKVLQWHRRFLENSSEGCTWSFNVERSLRFGDRIHGHLVTGHVEGLGRVIKIEDLKESRLIEFQVPEATLPFIWKKGSITVNGVSLTVNETHGNSLKVCLIPESMRRTNLGFVKVGDWVHIEPDYMARAISRSIECEKKGFLSMEITK